MFFSSVRVPSRSSCLRRRIGHVRVAASAGPSPCRPRRYRASARGRCSARTNSAASSGGVHHGLGHDLDERDASAVEIDVGAARRRCDVLCPRPLSEMDALSASGSIRRAPADEHVDVAGRSHSGLVELRDLVVLRLVRIEVVLARESAAVSRADLRRRWRRRGSERELERARDCTTGSVAQAGRGRPGSVSELGGCNRTATGGRPRTPSTRGRELHVDLEADHGLHSLERHRELGHAMPFGAQLAEPERALDRVRPRASRVTLVERACRAAARRSASPSP